MPLQDSTHAYRDLALEQLVEENVLLEARLVSVLQEVEAYRCLAQRAIAYCHRLAVTIDDRRRRHIIPDLREEAA